MDIDYQLGNLSQSVFSQFASLFIRLFRNMKTISFCFLQEVQGFVFIPFSNKFTGHILEKRVASPKTKRAKFFFHFQGKKGTFLFISKSHIF